MAKRMGIWIDRHEAIVCTLSGREASMERVPSGVEGRGRVSGGARSSSPYGAQDVTHEGRRKERRRHQTRRFHQQVLVRLADADGIVLFGPGVTRRELEQAIRRSRDLGRLLIGSFAAERPTEPQLVARIREAFGEPARRLLPRNAAGGSQGRSRTG